MTHDVLRLDVRRHRADGLLGPHERSERPAVALDHRHVDQAGAPEAVDGRPVVDQRGVDEQDSTAGS